MVKTRSKTRNQNHDDDDASSSQSCKRRFKTSDNSDVAQWSNVNHDVLFLVMMQLGIVDFIAFSGVCKSWRSFALSNRNMFMMSKPPMKLRIQPTDPYFYLEDFEGRMFKTILPHSVGRTYFGFTCGYVILFGRVTRDFWLVNPITRHELHFPNYPLYVSDFEDHIRPILVFSPSISGWVFVVPHKKISFCIAGNQRWNHVSSTIPIIDLHVFKGKIYTLHGNCSLGELRLNPKSKWKGKWTLLETKNLPNASFYFWRIMSTNDSLYLINWVCKPKKVMQLDFGEMKWVSPEKTIEEHAIFVRCWKSCAVIIKPESWAGSWRQQFKSHGQILDTGESSQQGVFCYEGPWYFHHHYLNVVNMLDE